MRRSVLLVDLGAHFGGVENYLLSLVALLEGEMDVFALCVLGQLELRLRQHGVRVVRLPVCAGVLKPLRFMLAFLLLPVLLLRFRIDVVQVNGLLESLLLLPARMAGRAAIYTRHGPFEMELYSPLKHPLKFLPRKAAQFNVRLATHVICVSNAVAESVNSILPPARYSVIPNWVSTKAIFTSPRSQLTPHPRVLCASRLEHYKGVHLLIEAASKLPYIEVTIVGEGSYRASLELQASTLTNVRFAGFQQEMRPFYESADIYVMPSMGPEGLPMTSLEAMSYGIACIFSDLTVHQEITDGGRGALLFRSGHADALQAALEELCSRPDARASFAAEAHRIVVARYTDQSVRADYLRVMLGDKPVR